MKLFDYKFLILLALTLVVYFMFREIIDLRNKIDTLESKVKTIEVTTNNSPQLANQNKPKIENKPVFQIPLPKPPAKKTMTVENVVNESNIVLQQNENNNVLQENKLSTINENEDATESESFVNSQIEKLEIYSNDNLDNDDDDFSLGDSSEIDLNAIEDELRESDATESDNSNTSSEKNEGVTFDFENKKETQNFEGLEGDSESKKKNLLVEFEGTNLLNNFVTNSEKDIDMILSSNTSDIKSNSGEITIKSLMKLKLAELQCMAEEKNISLVNEEKGKKKTKTELSNELLTVL